MVATLCDIYEAVVDVNISATYCCEPSDVETNDTRTEDWLIVKDPIRSHISSIGAKDDPNILESALNTSLHASKFAAAIGSTTVDYE